MLRSFLIAAALALASSTLALPTDPFRNTTEVRRTCGSTPSSEYIAAAEAHFIEHKMAPEPNKGRAKIIQVCFHVIYKNKSCVSLLLNDKHEHLTSFMVFLCLALNGGYLPGSQITKQIKRLNTDYAGSGYAFSLTRTTRTRNADWFDNAGPDTSQQTAMKKALRIGGAATLNLYSVGFVSGSGAGLLGYATFPWSYSSAPKDDGVVFLYSTVPGGTQAKYNLGRTITHEVRRMCSDFSLNLRCYLNTPPLWDANLIVSGSSFRLGRSVSYFRRRMLWLGRLCKRYSRGSRACVWLPSWP